MYKTKFYFIMIFVILSLMVGCGRQLLEDEEYVYDISMLRGVEGLQLTILAPARGQWRINTAVESFQRAMEGESINVQVDVETFMPQNVEQRLNLALSQFNIGIGADIIIDLPLYPFIQEGFLSDIYTVIDRVEHLNLDDFFSCILEAHEVEGRLYTIPMGFNFNYIELNPRLPQSFIEEVLANERISLWQMHYLQQQLSSIEPLWGDYPMISGLTPFDIFVPEIGETIRFENNSVNFLNTLETTDSNPIYDFATLLGNLYRQGQFVQSHNAANSEEAIFNATSTPNNYTIPLADNSGRAIGQNTLMNVSISTEAQPLLALMFIEHLVTVLAEDDSQHIPILRRFHDSYEIPQPINAPITSYLMPSSVVASAIANLISNEVSDNAFKLLEQDITRWLNTERSIQELTLTPIRKLTVFTPSNLIPFFEQAERAMNESLSRLPDWERFELVLNIDSYDFLDFVERDASITRLQVELMAGQGPDIIIYDGQPIRAWAENGFFVDIYTLMDNRDDFFTQALTAFEINDRLYMFPASFGFHYVAINSNAPPSIINRFSEYQTITIPQLMAIYIEFMEEYRIEYGRWAFGNYPLMPFSLIQYVMGEYIDFNQRQASFTSNSFNEFLENVAVIGTSPRLQYGTQVFRSVAEILEFYHDSQLFTVASGNNEPIYAFFTPANPFFKHYIPLVDAQGRLIIDYQPLGATTTWANFSIVPQGNEQLAWELIQYTIHAFSRPSGATLSAIPWPMGWGQFSMSTPISRSLFEEHTQRAMAHHFNSTSPGNIPLWQNVEGISNLNTRALLFQNAIERIAELNELPMTLNSPRIPPMPTVDVAIEQFLLGIIPADVLATRIQNTFQLWLIE